MNDIDPITAALAEVEVDPLAYERDEAAKRKALSKRFAHLRTKRVTRLEDVLPDEDEKIGGSSSS